jgi:nitrite reductase/ring-hydroxylating ferredoxin subunit
MSEKQVQIAVPGQVTEGTLLAIDADGLPVLLSRVNGKVHAVVNRCPHMGMKMSRGNICNGIVKCPWHGSRYEFCSGENVDWVNSFAGVPMPRWTHKIIAMGRVPTGLMTLPVEERVDGIVVTVPDAA